MWSMWLLTVPGDDMEARSYFGVLSSELHLIHDLSFARRKNTIRPGHPGYETYGLRNLRIARLKQYLR